jgi:hypothetical protein
LDRFAAAAGLIQSAGDGDATLSQLLAAEAAARGLNGRPLSSGAAAASYGEAEANARRDLEAMGFSNLDALAAVKRFGTDTDAAMMWLLQERDTPTLKGERYVLNFDSGPLGVKVTSGNSTSCDFPIVKPSEGGSKHISTWENAHLPKQGHVIEAYSVQGGDWVLLAGTVDEVWSHKLQVYFLVWFDYVTVGSFNLFFYFFEIPHHVRNTTPVFMLPRIAHAQFRFDLSQLMV